SPDGRRRRSDRQPGPAASLRLPAARAAWGRAGARAVVPEHVGSSGPPWRLRAAKQSVRRRTRMKLHGNAALSWSGRRRLAARVVVEGWTLSAAAAAALGQ